MIFFRYIDTTQVILSLQKLNFVMSTVIGFFVSLCNTQQVCKRVTEFLERLTQIKFHFHRREMGKIFPNKLNKELKNVMDSFQAEKLISALLFDAQTCFCTLQYVSEHAESDRPRSLKCETFCLCLIFCAQCDKEVLADLEYRSL